MSSNLDEIITRLYLNSCKICNQILTKTMNTSEYSNTLNQNQNYSVQVSFNELPKQGKSTVEAYNNLSLITVVSITLVGISFLIWRSHLKKDSSKFPKLFHKDSTQTNCTKCFFFDNNSYLKCAVHPTKVLKREAQNCLDFQDESNYCSPPVQSKSRDI